MPSKWIGRKTRLAIYARDNMECCYCGKTCVRYTRHDWKHNTYDVITLDHIVSQWEIAQSCESDAEFSRERKNPKNLVAVCNGCNSHKKHTPLFVWVTERYNVGAIPFDYATILERIASRIKKELV